MLSLSYYPTDTLYMENNYLYNVNLLKAKGAVVFIRKAPLSEDASCLTP